MKTLKDILEEIDRIAETAYDRNTLDYADFDRVTELTGEIWRRFSSVLLREESSEGKDAGR